jgi:mRNA interferase MazF
MQLLRVTIPARDRLRETCQIIVDQPRTLDRSRIGEGPLTFLTGEEMQRVERGLRVATGLYVASS